MIQTSKYFQLKIGFFLKTFNFFTENKNKNSRADPTASAMQYHQMQLHAQQQAWWMQQQRNNMGNPHNNNHPMVKQEAEDIRYAFYIKTTSLYVFLHLSMFTNLPTNLDV